MDLYPLFTSATSSPAIFILTDTLCLEVAVDDSHSKCIPNLL